MGAKNSILLEELGADYRRMPSIGKGQHAPAFLAPNKIPAIHDHDTAYFYYGSAARMIYLRKNMANFCLRLWRDVLQWLMWQMGGLGPMLALCIIINLGLCRRTVYQRSNPALWRSGCAITG